MITPRPPAHRCGGADPGLPPGVGGRVPVPEGGEAAPATRPGPGPVRAARGQPPRSRDPETLLGYKGILS